MTDEEKVAEKAKVDEAATNVAKNAIDQEQITQV